MLHGSWVHGSWLVDFQTKGTRDNQINEPRAVFSEMFIKFSQKVGKVLYARHSKGENGPLRETSQDSRSLTQNQRSKIPDTWFVDSESGNICSLVRMYTDLRFVFLDS